MIKISTASLERSHWSLIENRMHDRQMKNQFNKKIAIKYTDDHTFRRQRNRLKSKKNS